MARPRGEIPQQQERELERARDGLAKADSRFRSAVVAAIDAGGSYSVVAETAQIARSNVQKIVDSTRT